MSSLPKWMQRAVKDQVLSPQEAQEWHQVALSTSDEWINLPDTCTRQQSACSCRERPGAQQPAGVEGRQNWQDFPKHRAAG